MEASNKLLQSPKFLFLALGQSGFFAYDSCHYHYKYFCSVLILNWSQNLQKSIINLHTNLESSPASVSEAVLQIYKRSSKQQLANTIIDLNEIESGTVIANSLKDRILRSALSSKNIQLEKFTKSPLLNLPTLMEIIIKSEE